MDKKMTLDEEMKVWEERFKDEFGNILWAIRDLTKDYFVVEDDEYGMPSTPLTDYITHYAVYGNRKYVYNAFESILTNYDILGNDEGVEGLMKELKELVK